MFKRFAIALAFLFQIAPALAWIHGAPGGVLTLARSQFGPNFMASYDEEFALRNRVKVAGGWVYGNNTGIPKPTELDANGYLLSGANWTTQGGAYKLFSIPLQAENPTDYVLVWLGQGKFTFAPNAFGATGVSCTGVAGTAGSQPTCDNRGCSTFTGSISGTTLTVTAAPTGTGCTLGAGIPVSGQISTFDTMTVITTAGSACGGNTCYTVNQSQTLGNGTMVMGGRFRISFGATIGYGSAGAYLQQMLLSQTATSSGVQQVSNFAVFGLNEETDYWNSATGCGNGKACVVSSIFKTRTQQANFSILRDLNWGAGNVGSCSTWGSRKPLTYSSYNATELRNAAAGNETYTVQGTVYTIPKIGQYVDAGGTGASGGTIALNAISQATTTGWIAPLGSITSTYHVTSIGAGAITVGNTVTGAGVADRSYITSQTTTAGGDVATYIINGAAQTVFSSGSPGALAVNENDFNITLGSGAPVDKQTIIVRMPAAGDATSKFSLNGTTSVPVLAKSGAPISTSAGGSFPPTLNGEVATFFYDATIGGFLYYSSSSTNNGVGIDCAVPPEISMEIAAELQMARWHVPPMFSQDPATDWVTQDATYQKANYASNYSGTKKPIYEPQNEPFNTVQVNACYMSIKTSRYNAIDPTAWPVGGIGCGFTGANNYGYMGKIVSTAGQDLVSVYGAGNFELTDAVQTTFPPGGQLYPALTSVNYVNQTLIPVQAGYTQTAAYRYATRISNANYWNPGVYCGTGGAGSAPCTGTGPTNSYRGLEAGLGYCYYNYSISSACQGLYANQAAVMTAYMNSSLGTTCGTGSCNTNITAVLAFMAAWKTQALVCFTASTRPASCTVDQTSPIFMYEGTYSLLSVAGDLTNNFTAATNANPAVLTIPNNGCVAGQTVALSSLSGGTWSTAAGSYTVQASGTDSGHCAINLDATGLGALTAATLTYTGSTTYVNNMRQASYLSADLPALTTAMYTGILANGGANPSQFNLTDAGPLFGSPWVAYGNSIYSGLPMGTCTACTIASTTLTLGGTITGMFRTGDVLYGTSVTGLGAGSASNTVLGACTPIGANVCGTAANDTFALNQASSIAVGAKMQTVSPVPSTAWGAIRAWNGNP